MAISRVNTTELRVQVYNYLVDQILNGDLKPGDSIAESKLASEFNISRTPVREAVRQLAASGILESKPNCNTTVAKWNDEKILQLEIVRTDMENLEKEMEKLFSYTLGQTEITVEDVEEICTSQVTNQIFAMVEAVAEKKQKKALELYYDLLSLKEPPMRILFLIARQFNQILQVKELMGQGMDKSTIASRMKLQPFVAGKIMLQAKTFSREQILSYVNLCVDAEESVKTGRLTDRLAVELLIAKTY